MTNDFTGITLRFTAQGMKGANQAKGKRTAVCLGWVEGMGWAFVPTTSSWKADWQRDINQTRGWEGWDLRYRKPITWTPNMVFYISSEEVEEVIAEDGRIGWAPTDVINHGIDELNFAIDNGLMTRRAWFAQAGRR